MAKTGNIVMLPYGMRVVIDPSIPPDEIHVRDVKTGALVKIVNLAVPAHPEGSR